MLVDFYAKPDGRVRTLEIKSVYPEDREFFELHNIRVSMEDIGGMFAIYADIGKKTEDGYPDELMELSGQRSCEETLNALRMACEIEMKGDQS